MKKIILIIVEGKSEKLSLEGLFSRLKNGDDQEVKFDIAFYTSEHINGGDILQSNDPLKHIRSTVKKHLNRHKYRVTDLSKVILLADIDGCYIDDSKVIEKPGVEINCTANEIICTNKVKLVERNQRKRDAIATVLNYPMLAINQHSCPFECYFSCCNLDHLLHDDANLPNTNKVKMAQKFALEFSTNLEGFLILMKTHTLGYQTSSDLWHYIRHDNHSLTRCSNIYFFLVGEPHANNP